MSDLKGAVFFNDIPVQFLSFDVCYDHITWIMIFLVVKKLAIFSVRKEINRYMRRML